MKIKAKHDKLIDQLLADPSYVIHCTGQIFRNGKLLGFSKKGELEKRGKAYMYLSYKGVQLKIHRIIYRKFCGELKRDKVVHHLNGNGIDNMFTNLQLVSQADNNYYRYHPTAAWENI